MLGSGPALGSDTPAATSGDQPEPTIASELDTFNVAVNKQLQVIGTLSTPGMFTAIPLLVYVLPWTRLLWARNSHNVRTRATLQLQGDPRDAIINFVRDEEVDLLLVGRSLGGRFKKVHWHRKASL